MTSLCRRIQSSRGRAEPFLPSNTRDARWWTDSFTAGTRDCTLIYLSYRRLFTWKIQQHSGSNLMNRCKSTLCPFLSSFTLKCQWHISFSLSVTSFFFFKKKKNPYTCLASHLKKKQQAYCFLTPTEITTTIKDKHQALDYESTCWE